ncbi:MULTISPECIES: hypothetical protein [Dyella]|uniref:Uncharacterized protein n=2 Tax=Dyella TaxID=231454 RepID=A0A4R0Z1N9_9GAMM|nr:MULTISPECIES: hypothetical protein [Dyella]TBR40238.1 hypothetical protein EYV96_08750 [Dyella terrae]TCI12180.1 hypothetical protein EZM97_02120 [Dyella soli]
MFGWLTRFPWCSRTHGACQRWLAFDPGQLAAHLPALGSVLYQWTRDAEYDAMAPTRGWLVQQPHLRAVVGVTHIQCVSMVGARGPREWFDCIDMAGQVRARIYLLPDTDYLAWDALMASGTPVQAPPSWRPTYSHRRATAKPVQFQCRTLPGLTLLQARRVEVLSTLGRDVAEECAGAEMPGR